MAEGSFKRKLAAVFSVDVVGNSRLVGEDETATVRTLEFGSRYVGVHPPVPGPYGKLTGCGKAPRPDLWT